MPELDLSALHLPARYLDIVRQVLQATAPEAEVWAYGSRVRGDHYDASDLDLVLRHPGDLQRPWERYWRLEEAFQESDLPIQVQVVDWARIPASFHDEIKAAYVVVQQAGKVSLDTVLTEEMKS